MRTLILLAALLLLAFQALADPLPGAAEGSPDEDQTEEEKQDMGISFEGPEISALQRAGTRPSLCFCRRDCQRGESLHGVCFQSGRRHALCCKRSPSPRTLRIRRVH